MDLETTLWGLGFILLAIGVTIALFVLLPWFLALIIAGGAAFMGVAWLHGLQRADVDRFRQ